MGGWVGGWVGWDSCIGRPVHEKGSVPPFLAGTWC